jgi:hypothetical protein
MPSQPSHSSKPIDRLKQNKKQPGDSGFEFLLQSLDRDKENQAPNAHPIAHSSLSQSLHIDSQLTVPCSRFSRHPQPPLFLDNVKVLDCSDLSISEASEGRPISKLTPKDYKQRDKKARELVASVGWLQQSAIQSQQVPKSQAEKQKHVCLPKHSFLELSSQVKQYIAVSSQLSPSHSPKLASRMRGLAKGIYRLMEGFESIQQAQLGTTVSWEGPEQAPVLLRSQAGSHGPDDYARVISQLESERDRLRGLVSEHELANIRMFVQLNDG